MAKPVLGKSLCSYWFFLGQDFALRAVSMEMAQPVFFCFGAKPANLKFATKTAKKQKKMWILSFFTAKLPEKAKKIDFFRKFQRSWGRQTFSKRVLLSWRSGNFWCRNWNRHNRKPGGHRRFYQPTEKCKHKQEDGYWYEHSYPLPGS